MSTKQSILELISRSPLASPPDLLMKIIESLNSHMTAAEIGKIVSQDQVITAQIMKLANSSFFGFKGKTSTVDRAISLLGTKMVRNLVITSALVSHSSKIRLYNITPAEFWLNSFQCAEFSRELAATAKINADETYVAALLKDLGKLILYTEQKPYPSFMDEYFTHKDIVDYEKEQWYFDSTELSIELLKSWNLPSSIIQAIEGSTDPNKADLLGKSVYVGQQISEIISYPSCKFTLTTEGFNRLIKELNLDHKAFEDYFAGLPLIAERSKQIISTIGKSDPKSQTTPPQASDKNRLKVTLVSEHENSIQETLLKLFNVPVNSYTPKEIDEILEFERTGEQEKPKLEEIQNKGFSIFNLFKKPEPPPRQSLLTPKRKKLIWNPTVLVDKKYEIDIPERCQLITIADQTPKEQDKTLPSFFCKRQLEDEATPKEEIEAS